jgi:hypothetical protein
LGLVNAPWTGLQLDRGFVLQIQLQIQLQLQLLMYVVVVVVFVVVVVVVCCLLSFYGNGIGIRKFYYF